MRLFKTRSVWHRGERAALKHMKNRGCALIARNLRLPMGEIDLLCRERATGTLVIVEVKARAFHPNNQARRDPAANITAKKQAKLRTLAKALKRDPMYASTPIRIDVVSVIFETGRRRPLEIKHYRSAVTDS